MARSALPPVQGSAYGVTVRSEQELGPLLHPAAEGLPELILERRAAPPSAADHVTSTSVVVALADGRWLAVERAGGRATVHGPPPDADEVVHPLLGAAATVIARWRSLEVLHAGSFAIGDGAVGVLGGHGAGKSTLLAALAARGLAIMADDLAFTDGRLLHAGPRSLDLRAPVAPNARLRPVRHDRLRMTLAPSPARLPLLGWVQLEWGASLELQPIAASELLRALIASRSLGALPSDPRVFLMLASVPGWRLRRPADLARLEESVETLLAEVAGAAP